MHQTSFCICVCAMQDRDEKPKLIDTHIEMPPPKKKNPCKKTCLYTRCDEILWVSALRHMINSASFSWIRRSCFGGNALPEAAKRHLFKRPRSRIEVPRVAMNMLTLGDLLNLRVHICVAFTWIFAFFACPKFGSQALLTMRAEQKLLSPQI